MYADDSSIVYFQLQKTILLYGESTDARSSKKVTLDIGITPNVCKNTPKQPLMTALYGESIDTSSSKKVTLNIV